MPSVNLAYTGRPSIAPEIYILWKSDLLLLSIPEAEEKERRVAESWSKRGAMHVLRNREETDRSEETNKAARSGTHPKAYIWTSTYNLASTEAVD